MAGLWQEMKRRNLVRVALAYIVVAWVILQAASLLFDIFELPGAMVKAVAIFLILGFPLACLFAWAYELTPDGLKRSEDVAPEHSVTSGTARRLERITMGFVALLALFLLWDRFAAPQSDPVASSEEAPATSIQIAGPSIAVLPFADMSPEKDQEYFTDGISEELLNVLARTEGLRVAARTSSFAFKNRNEDIREIGQLLDVDHVLEGSIRKSGLRIRVTAQLIDVESGYHLWSDTFDGELTDIFAVQDEISAAIHRALKLHLLGSKEAEHVTPAANTKAYEHYLIGREYLRERGEDIKLAQTELAASLAEDPDFGPAHAAMGLAWTLLADTTMTYGELSSEEVIAKAAPHFARARELTPDDPELHAAYGFYIHTTDGLSEDAMASLARAIEINPNLSIAYTWRAIVRSAIGDAAGSLADDERAYALDPMSALAGSNLIRIYIRTAKFDKADLILAHLKKIAPGTLQVIMPEAFLASARGDVLAELGVYAEFLETPGAPMFIAASVGETYASLGLHDLAIHYSPLNEAYYTLLSGNAEHALDLAGKMYATEANPYNLPVYLLYQHKARLGLVAAAAGDMELARSLLLTLEAPISDQCTPHGAVALAIIGATDRAAESVAWCEEEYANYVLSSPDLNESHYLSALVFLLKHDIDSAARALERAHELKGVYNISFTHPLFARGKDHAGFLAIKSRADARVDQIRQEVLAMHADGSLPDPLSETPDAR